MSINTDNIDAPAHWASAIVNRDYSGLDQSETKALNTFLLNNGLSFVDCLMCSNEPFIGQFQGLTTQLLTYTFRKT